LDHPTPLLGVTTQESLGVMQLGRCNELCVECCERHLAEHTLLAAAHSLQANTTVLGV